MEDRFGNWVIRRVIYPVVDNTSPTISSEKTHPEYWPTVSSVTRVEIIWTERGWPTVDDVYGAVYRCQEIFAVYPDIIMASFPTNFQGIDIR